MNKNLSKAVTLRTKLRNILLKNWTDENKGRYTKQRNLCVTFLQKSKREYFKNLKLVSAIFYQIFIFSPNDSPSKTMKNVFYFI